LQDGWTSHDSKDSKDKVKTTADGADLFKTHDQMIRRADRTRRHFIIFLI
jgi:hypothetical protein